MKCHDDQYATMQKNYCLLRYMTFLAHEDTMGKTLAATTWSLIIMIAAILALFVKHRNTPIVKASYWALSYILLICLTFCLLCTLIFIGHPYTATYIFQQTTFGFVFTVALSIVSAEYHCFWPSSHCSRQNDEVIGGIGGSNFHHPHLPPDPTHSLWLLDGDKSTLH